MDATKPPLTITGHADYGRDVLLADGLIVQVIPQGRHGCEVRVTLGKSLAESQGIVRPPKRKLHRHRPGRPVIRPDD